VDDLDRARDEFRDTVGIRPEERSGTSKSLVLSFFATLVIGLSIGAGLFAWKSGLLVINMPATVEVPRGHEQKVQLLRAEDEVQLRPGSQFRECSGCPLMVVVPSGQFTMGASAADIEAGDAPKSSAPARSVTISRPFAVGKFEVTFSEFDACVSAGGCRNYRPGDNGLGRGTRPVINISWDDAKLYVRWLSTTTGKVYRLLSEAEWEYAARAGSTTKYHFGNDEKSLCGFANVADASGSQEKRGNDGFGTWQLCDDGHFKTAPVGSFRPNDFGLYDVHGNVSEWVEDPWHDDYTGAPSDERPWTTGGSVSFRIARGGSFYHLASGVTSTYRFKYHAADQGNLIGFRVARTLAQ
jgi:formylglycine-generating enzyme required for sulfatase activity